ncbi:hypothetical protein ACQP1P_44985 [Dactylosporangium sp. CA-052675]|uniref:hypothetical protein n=1 Tax=Dactylosporangium sp. CA-052675 TaxID=3239927 RepID=UPI003D90EFF6
MGVLHGLLVAVVIGLIAVAPCLICALLMSADEVLARGWELTRRLLPERLRRRLDERARRRYEAQSRRRWKESRAERAGRAEGTEQSERLARSQVGWWRLNRIGRGAGEAARDRGEWAAGPPIEQVAGDLRRLNRLRESVAMRSRVWFVAVQEAYDEGLHVACAQLGVEEHLGELAGIDLEVERLRVEGELQRAGLVLRNASAQSR